MHHNYELVIFDLAGTTVLDVGDPVANCLLRVIKSQVGIDVPLASAVRVMGIPKPMAIAELLKKFAGGAKPELVDSIHKAFVRGMIDYYKINPAAVEIPGTSETFRKLRAAGMKIGVDTGFSRDITDAILDRMGWCRQGLIDVSVTSDEVISGRPAPYLVHRAMQLTGVHSIARVVKVGDTPSDLWEGTNAGCGRVIGVCRGSHTREQLLSSPHTDLISDVTELPDVLARSSRPTLQLHTPGPANASQSVRAAMSRDIGAWDRELIDLVADVRSRLLKVAGLDAAAWDCVLLQGSGTYGVEATLSSATPILTDDGRPGKLLVIANGAYGQRMARIAETLSIAAEVLTFAEDEPVDPNSVAQKLASLPDITTVSVVHCETTTGILNDVVAIGRAIHAVRPDVEFVVDAMSSFGAYSIDTDAGHIDWLVASSNKCLQGVPGIACVLARRTRLEASSGRARSLALDLYDQWRGFETHGRFRFTPPTHVLLALQQALVELEREGGPQARLERYSSLYRTLVAGLESRGYQILIQPQHRSAIITTVTFPGSPNFRFADFYSALHRRGFVIYPGKLTKIDCFRVGHIGDLQTDDIERLLKAFDEVADELAFAPYPPAVRLSGPTVIVSGSSNLNPPRQIDSLQTKEA